jgi:hypothetical protein
MRVHLRSVVIESVACALLSSAAVEQVPREETNIFLPWQARTTMPRTAASLPCSATIASAALVTAVGSNSTRGVNSGFCRTFDRRVVMVFVCVEARPTR